MKNKQQMLTEPVKRFLIQCVSKAGSRPERLLNELELCERFSVSRRTVRKAISDLLDIGYIQHLEGRRGVFSNPDYATVVPYSVGILGSCGNCSYMDTSSTAILGEFMLHSQDPGFMTTFLTLNHPPGEADRELLVSGLDALLWIQPSEDYHPAIERAVRKHHFPILVVGSLANSAAPLLPFNTFGVDYRAIGLQYSCYLKQKNCKRVLFCGRDGLTYQTLRKSFLENASAGSALELFTDQDDLSAFVNILKREKIDTLICNGCNNLHHNIFKKLSALPEGKEYPVILSPGLRFSSLQEEYKNLSLHAVHKEQDPALYSRIGRAVARHLKEILRENRNYCFENEFFQWDLQ